MKGYEEAADATLPDTLLMARIDGRCFSGFTRGLIKPFDIRLNALMTDLTEKMMRHVGACLGYHQSDEITLVWPPLSQPYFGGRVQKMSSSLAAQATLIFNERLFKHFGCCTSDQLCSRHPTFDARVWAVPDEVEVYNNLLWRTLDCRRNSITGAARSVLSHKQIHGLSCEQLLLIPAVREAWNKEPEAFRLGTFVQRHTSVRRFTAEEIDKLPAKHEARTNPDLTVERSDYRACTLRLQRLNNWESFIYDGASANVTMPF